MPVLASVETLSHPHPPSCRERKPDLKDQKARTGHALGTTLKGAVQGPHWSVISNMRAGTVGPQSILLVNVPMVQNGHLRRVTDGNRQTYMHIL